MITFKDENLGEIILVGYILKINRDFYDLRTNYDLKTKSFVHNIQKDLNLSDVDASAFNENLMQVLWRNENWGKDEEDWQDALASSDEIVRAMVAYSGKYLETASKDSHYIVRYCAVQGLCEMKKAGLDVGNIDWLDKLVDDENHSVRFAVIQYGKKEHLDKLIFDESFSNKLHVIEYNHQDHFDMVINDENDYFRAYVATHGTDENRTTLLNDASTKVKIAIATYGTDEHRAKLLADPDCASSVRVAVLDKSPQTLEIIQELACDKDKHIRMYVASKGKSEWVSQTDLACDADPFIRLELAFRGINIDTLINDEVDSIKSVAQNYPNKVSRIKHTVEIIRMTK